MTSRTHDVFAFATLITAAVYYPPNNLGAATIIVALIANIVGALLPDIDQASNRLWDLLPGGDFLGKFLKEIFLSHRTLSHSLLGIGLIYEASGWLLPKLLNGNFVDNKIIITAIMIGYLSHLLIDSFTEEGLPLLFPVKWKFGFPPIKSWRIKTGKWFEKYVVFPGIVLYILWFSYSNQKILSKLILGN